MQMLQKIDWDVAYVAMVVHVCCKRLSQMFHLFLCTYVVSVSDACLKCFICFLLYVASKCFKSKSGCCTCCNSVSTICHKYFISFRRILQMFRLDVAKVDLVFECCSGTLWGYNPRYPQGCTWAEPPREAQPIRSSHAEHGTGRRVSQDCVKHP
jgi:hypothetical protein